MPTGTNKIVIQKKYYTEKFSVANQNGETILERNTIFLYFKATRDNTKFNLYLLGDNYQSTPEEFNFTQYSNQDDYIITNELDWYRNTAPYNLIEGDIPYPYISIPDSGTPCSPRWLHPGR